MRRMSVVAGGNCGTSAASAASSSSGVIGPSYKIRKMTPGVLFCIEWPLATSLGDARMDSSRREFGKLALAGVPALALIETPLFGAGLLQAKPNSKFSGVQ